MQTSKFKPGGWVEIRSKEEILKSLDAHGRLDGLPFMPEMLALCGQRFRVFKSAHKTCDTVNHTGGRKMRDAVHLEGTRCNGAGHDGCQAACMLFWKSDWLKSTNEGAKDKPKIQHEPSRCDEQALHKDAKTETADGPTYSCQATQLYAATTTLPGWDLRQYVTDVRSGNVSFKAALTSLLLAIVFKLRKLPIGYRFTTRLYDRAHESVMGCSSPLGRGGIPLGQKTPHEELGLQRGDVVEVKSHAEILATLNERNHNRGLSFDKEMVRYCGQHFRVGDRVTQIINEQTGKMLKFPTTPIVLEGTFCTSRYSERRLLCPRRIVPYWREIWVRKVADPSAVNLQPSGEES